MNTELQDLLTKQEAAQQQIAEIITGIQEAEHLQKHAPQQLYSLKAKLSELLADYFLGKSTQDEIQQIENDISHINQAVGISDQVIQVLNGRMQDVKSETSLDEIKARIIFLKASENYPTLRDEIIKAGKLPLRGLENFKSTARQANEGQEASRLIDALKKRKERNDWRKPFTFPLDPN